MNTLRGSKINLTQVMVLCATTQLLVILDSSILSVATPHIGQELGFTPVSLQLISNAYTAALASSILLMGRCADNFGRRRVLFAGIALFGLASLICGFAPNQALFIGGRILQGMASAAIVGSNLALIIECFEDQGQRLKAIGLWGAAGGMGGALGAFIGGVLVEYTDWRVAMLINVPVVIYLLAYPMRRVGKDGITKSGKIDLQGGVFLTATLTFLLLGIMAFTDGKTATAGLWILGFALAAYGFVLTERRAVQPLLSLSLLRSRGVLGSSLVMFFGGGAMASAFYFLTLQLQLVEGYTPLRTGIAFLPLSIAIFIGGMTGSKIQQIIGPRLTLTLGSFLAAVGLASTAAFLADSHIGIAVFVATVFGFGVALILTSAAASATGSVAQANAGFAAGMISTSQHYGAVIVMASLILFSEQLPIFDLSAGRFNVGILGASVVCLIACATAFIALPRNPLRTPSLSEH